MNTNTTSTEIHLSAEVPPNYAGKRLDQIAGELFPQYSRARLQSWIKSGELLVNGCRLKQTAKLLGGELIEIEAVEREQGEWLPEEMDLAIVYEDDFILVLNKPAGLVVHPAAGNWSGTLLNGLLAHADCFRLLPRAGIVHRLDKDTSGLMVVAKNLEAQNKLVQQLQGRAVKRQYRAFSMAGPDRSGTIDAPIGRHPRVRTKMAVVKAGGKEAVSHYQVSAKLQYFRDLLIDLDTGRTHQIRVHMSHLGFPLVGDQVYGKKLPAKLELTEQQRVMVESFPRQALHAQRLGLLHPGSSEKMEWSVGPPEDMLALLSCLQAAV